MLSLALSSGSSQLLGPSSEPRNGGKVATSRATAAELRLSTCYHIKCSHRISRDGAIATEQRGDGR